MYRFLGPLKYLPLLELIGLFAIGGRVGFFGSLVWLAGATMLGFHLLKNGGFSALSEKTDRFFAAQEGFDKLCVLIAALLLIFPGFISDFLAIPFLLAPARHYLFRQSQKDPNGFMHQFTRDSAEFREWTYKKTATGDRPEPPVIEGEFRRMDDEKIDKP
ncbi:MAG TPA: FxsA family protein [Patescibacteria group bacterium]|nr:FxsA family protein [Patescibacteria group bacterium]